MKTPQPKCAKINMGSCRCPGRHRFATRLLLGLLLLVLPATAQKTYYFYNSIGDGYNNFCEGYLWQQMGFLDQNGKPAVEVGNNLMIGRNQVGTVVQRDAGNQLASIYASWPNGNRILEDLNRQGITVKRDFGPNQNDLLFVCGHGGSHTHAGNGQTHIGGTIQLDTNTPGSVQGFFAGFSNPFVPNGTNVNGLNDNFGQPYPFNAVPQNFPRRARLYTCNGSRNPGGQNEISVSVSLRRTGVPTVISDPQVTFARAVITVVAKNPLALANSIAALQRTARNAGFNPTPGGIESWLGSIPFAQEYQRAQAVLDQAVGRGNAILVLRYIEPSPQNGGIPGIAGCATECTDSACTVDFSNLGFGSLSILAGSLPPQPATVLDPVQLDATQLPQGPGPLIGPVVSLMGVNQGTTALQNGQYASLTLPYFADSGCTPLVYRLNGSVWTQMNGAIEDPIKQTVNVPVDQLATYGVFADSGCQVQFGSL